MVEKYNAIDRWESLEEFKLTDIFDIMNWVRLQSNFGSFERRTHLHKDFDNWLMIQFPLLLSL